MMDQAGMESLAISKDYESQKMSKNVSSATHPIKVTV